MGDLKGPDGVIFHEKFRNSHMAEDEMLNSESDDRQFGRADVYDIDIVSPNRNRVPGSMVRGKDNARDGTGTRREGRMGSNWAEGIDNPVGK